MSNYGNVHVTVSGSKYYARNDKTTGVVGGNGVEISTDAAMDIIKNSGELILNERKGFVSYNDFYIDRDNVLEHLIACGRINIVTKNSSYSIVYNAEGLDRHYIKTISTVVNLKETEYTGREINNWISHMFKIRLITDLLKIGPCNIKSRLSIKNASDRGTIEYKMQVNDELGKKEIYLISDILGHQNTGKNDKNITDILNEWDSAIKRGYIVTESKYGMNKYMYIGKDEADRVIKEIDKYR